MKQFEIHFIWVWSNHFWIWVPDAWWEDYQINHPSNRIWDNIFDPISEMLIVILNLEKNVHSYIKIVFHFLWQKFFFSYLSAMICSLLSFIWNLFSWDYYYYFMFLTWQLAGQLFWFILTYTVNAVFSLQRDVTTIKIVYNFFNHERDKSIRFLLIKFPLAPRQIVNIIE